MASFWSISFEEVPLVSLLELVEPRVDQTRDLHPLSARAPDPGVTHALQMLLQLPKPPLRHRDEDTPSHLPEEAHVLPPTGQKLRLRSYTPTERHLGERDHESAAREVVGSIY